jgi:lysozyme
MNLSDAGARFIAGHEISLPADGSIPEKYLVPYNDPVGLATIALGHLIAKRPVNDDDRRQWGKLTQAQAYDLFRSDLRRFIDAVAGMVTVPLTQNQFDALVSFAYNLGEGALKGSTLLKKLNAGDYKGAAAEFAKWNKARVNGVLKVLPGLTRRRKEEAELFMRASAGQPIDIPVAAGSDIKPVNGESLEVAHIRAYLKASGVPHRVTSTVRDKLPSRHAQKGTVGQGLALDAAGPKPGINTPEMLAIFEAFKPVEHLLYELIYSGADHNVKRGQRVARFAIDDHWNHVHIAVEKGVFLPIKVEEVIEDEEDEEMIRYGLVAVQGQGVHGVYSVPERMELADGRVLLPGELAKVGFTNGPLLKAMENAGVARGPVEFLDQDAFDRIPFVANV